MTWTQNWQLDATVVARAGNQGTVKKVVNLQGQFGALKQPRPETSLRKERISRFSTEVRVLEQLEIEGIPKILESGIENNQAPYFISEWVEGETLQNAFGGKSQNFNISVDLSIQLACLLRAVHKHDVVHRDIKPDNLIVASDGKLWLVDFGIAWMESEEQDAQLTLLQGSRMGNHFLSLPEFIDRGEKRDPRSDVTQAVGILFFLLTGVKPVQLRDAFLRPPHKGDSADRFQSIAKMDSRWPQVLSIFDIGFAQTLTYRFQNAEQYLERLQLLNSPSNSNSHLEEDPVVAAFKSYETKRLSIDAQIDELEQNLITVLNEIASSVSVVAASKDFNGPLINAAVERPGQEVAVLWQIMHKRNNEPYIFYKLRACLIGSGRNRLELRMTAQHQPMSSLDNVYFDVPSADITGFTEKGKGYARQIFADALMDLNRL